jgi:aminopeptidase YwaD
MERDVKNILNGVSPERLWRHHRKLCKEIGHRLLGTENDKRAAEYIESHFKSCGLRTSSQVFDCPSWDHYGTLIVTGKGHRISPPDGGACQFSLPCDVSGEIVNVTTLDELKKADIRGKVCVISGELRHGPIRSDRNPILLLIEEKEPVAVIVIDVIENGYQTKVIRDPEFKIPVCAVSANSGARLLEDGGEVGIKIEARRYKSTSRNIFATNAGDEEKKIRITAHYDTAADTPGAVDNGSGISIILEAAEAFMETGADIPVEFIAFGGEEYAMLGSYEYLAKYPQRVGNTDLVINVDGVGICNSRSRIFFEHGGERLDNVVRRLAEMAGGYHDLNVDKMFLGSDHELFYKRGIPTVFLNDMPDTLVWDTTLDISRNMCLERMEDAAKIVLGIVLEWVDYGIRG